MAAGTRTGARGTAMAASLEQPPSLRPREVARSVRLGGWTHGGPLARAADRVATLAAAWAVGVAEVVPVYALLMVAFGTEAYLLSLLTDEPFTWLKRVALSFTPWSAWAVVTPIIAALVRRYPIDPTSWRRHVPAHVAGVLLTAPIYLTAYVCAQALLYAMLGDWFEGMSSLALAWPHFFFGLGIRMPIVYGIIVAFLSAIAYARRQRERDVIASRLEAELAQARLHSLKAQLQPHFLFNALNAISGLIGRDPLGANRMLAQLASLLRAGLSAPDEQLVPLSRELEVLASYVEIEKVRFSNRLRVAVDIPEDLGEVPVPMLLLQPLVENAVRHGIAPRLAPGTVTITGRRAGDRLELVVSDDGVGPARPGGERLREGVGLANTRARLQHLFGDDSQFRYGQRAGGGFEVAISLPLGHPARVSGMGGPARCESAP